MLAFWLNQFVKYGVLYGVAYLTGQMVRHWNTKVNYTRKINHFTVFLAPIVLDSILPYNGGVATKLFAAFLTLATFATYAVPLRRRVPFLETVFLSYDRPEDRPWTLIWLTTQVAAGYAVIVPMVFLFKSANLMSLLTVPILINAIGDGLAEPVGIRFGKHRYRVPALFTKKTYTRSIEGSACVLGASVGIWVLLATSLPHHQFLLGLLVLPIAMTLAEAFSPHTWDTPILFLVGYSTIYLVSMV